MECVPDMTRLCARRKGRAGRGQPSLSAPTPSIFIPRVTVDNEGREMRENLSDSPTDAGLPSGRGSGDYDIYLAEFY